MKPIVAFFEFQQLSVRADEPESLCGVNAVNAALLPALRHLSSEFEFRILTQPQSVASVTSAVASLSQYGHLQVCSYDQFIAANERNDHVIVQALGHRIDRAALLRSVAGNARWSVVGMTHDLFNREVLESLALYGSLSRATGDTVVCASHTAVRILEHYIAEVEDALGRKLEIALPIIPHGINIGDIKRTPRENARKALGIPDNVVMFLYLGRLSLLHKADLVGLIRTFSQRFPHGRARLVVAGGAIDPPNNADLKIIRQEIQDWRRAEGADISCMENVGHNLKALLFSAADVFVSPVNSPQETFGLSIIEAMLYQLPVIATRWSGYQDIIQAGVTGLTADALWSERSPLADRADWAIGSDNERAMATSQSIRIDWLDFGQKMELLFRSPRAREQMGVAGLSRARATYDIDRIAGKYAQVWEEAVSRRRGERNCHFHAGSSNRIAHAMLNLLPT